MSMNPNGEHPIFREPNSIYRGLTKREWMSCMVLQGMLASDAYPRVTKEGLVSGAMQIADILLTELDKHS